jgi:hypothetical protein
MYIGREGGGDGHQTRFFFSKDRKLLFYFLGEKYKKYKGRRGSGDAIVENNNNNNNNKVNDTSTRCETDTSRPGTLTPVFR